MAYIVWSVVATNVNDSLSRSPNFLCKDKAAHCLQNERKKCKRKSEGDVT